uniref:Serine/threonine-protein kinase AFC2 isoform X1 n=1 Tax=Rhizophora mucronata TaxID=61149 RepID=A0A2P2MPK2_RHIMU
MEYWLYLSGVVHSMLLKLICALNYWWFLVICEDFLENFLTVAKGEALFQTHENLEHLAMMERVLGPLPQHMLKNVDRHAEKYIRRGKLDWPEGATSRESIKAVLKLPRLQVLDADIHTFSLARLFYLVLYIFFSLFVAESCNAACGPFRWRSYTFITRTSEVRSFR